MGEALIRFSDLSGERAPDAGVAERAISLDGAHCNIDLTDDEYAALKDFLAPYYAAGRTSGKRVTGLKEKRAQGQTDPPPDLTPEERADCRAYVKSVGWAVGDKGRVSHAHVQAWRDAGSPSRDGQTVNGHAAVS